MPRRKLKASGRPYWRAIGKGLHIGYRKGKTDGVWVVRRYLGGQTYKLETIAEADDILDVRPASWRLPKMARYFLRLPNPKLASHHRKDTRPRSDAQGR
ncbi:MAG TPA: hypothetical protein VFQ29_01065 [Methyloceanibacter sp.]|nr:hypothetical protein [Methyloceanibacter sp.]